MVGFCGLLAAAAVGERGAEAVPQQVGLLAAVADAGLGARERGVEAVDGFAVFLLAVEEHAQPDLHVRVHVFAVRAELRGKDEELGDALVQEVAVCEAEFGVRGQGGGGDDVGVFGGEPALEGAVGGAVPAVVGVADGQPHQRFEIRGVEFEGLFEGADGRGFFLVLGLGAAECDPGFDV